MGFFTSYLAEVGKHTNDAINAQPVDVAIVGATGCGKSSTINCLTGTRIAKASDGADPETMEIRAYYFNRALRLWDTPGLGDSPEKDKRHFEKIRQLLQNKYETFWMDYRLIDKALLIIDGGQRELHSTINVLNKLIIPTLGADRVILAVNQADRAMKGRYWDQKNRSANPELINFLKQQAKDLQQRLQDSTGCKLPRPLYYSATARFQVDELLGSVRKRIPKACVSR